MCASFAHAWGSNHSPTGYEWAGRGGPAEGNGKSRHKTTTLQTSFGHFIAHSIVLYRTTNRTKRLPETMCCQDVYPRHEVHVPHVVLQQERCSSADAGVDAGACLCLE